MKKTLRDEIAIAAMNGFIVTKDYETAYSVLIEESYKVADEFIKFKEISELPEEEEIKEDEKPFLCIHGGHKHAHLGCRNINTCQQCS